MARTSEQMMNQVLDELHDDFAKEAEASAVPENELPENELPKMIYRKIYRKKTHQKIQLQ